VTVKVTNLCSTFSIPTKKVRHDAQHVPKTSKLFLKACNTFKL